MNKYVAAYLAVALVMVALDMLWLGVIAKAAYQEGLGHLMAEEPLIPAAIAFYALYPVGLMVFAVVPQMEDAGWTQTLVMGALFGFFAYATYDLTNLATLKNWPIRWAMVDLAWGAVLSATSAGAGKAALNWVTRA